MVQKTKKLVDWISLDWVLKIIFSTLFALSLSWNTEGDFNFVLFIFSFCMTLLILSLVWDRLSDKKLVKGRPKEIKKSEFLVYGGLILAVLIVAILARYPGGVSPDVIYQYTQATTGEYNNWHPVLHTIFVFWLPQLFNHGLIATTVFQCMIIWGILMYFCLFCRKNFLNFWPTFLMLILIVMNPTFTYYSVTPWKDVLYAWSIFLCTLFLINIVISDGRWMESKWHKIIFIVTTVGILGFRHNGIIPFVVIYLGLAVFYIGLRRFSLITLASVMIVFMVVTGPIYRAFNISGTGGPSEMMGLMMGQISHYYQYHEKDFDEKDIQLLDKVTALENWKENYEPIGFNKIKFSHGAYRDDSYKTTNNVDANAKELVSLWANKSWQNPRAFAESYLNITSPIWQVGYVADDMVTEIDQEKTDLENKGRVRGVSNRIENEVINYNRFVSEMPFRVVFWGAGGGCMLILLAYLIVVRKSGRNLKNWLPFVAVAANTATVMLLITAGEVRFVYSQVLCAVPLLVYCFSNVDRRRIMQKTKGKIN